MRESWLMAAVFVAALPAAALESHSARFSNVSLDAGYAAAPEQPIVSSPVPAPRRPLAPGSDDNGRACCAVLDNGNGVPPSQRSRLFRRFARLSPPLRGKTGTGLGLHIGRMLARAQGGALDYAPLPNARGGRFRLTLRGTGRR